MTRGKTYAHTNGLSMEYSGGRATKCFTVNLFFKMQTIQYRYILIRYCSLTHKNVFVIKKVLDVKKMSSLSKLALWQENFHMGVGQQNVSL